MILYNQSLLSVPFSQKNSNKVTMKNLLTSFHIAVRKVNKNIFFFIYIKKFRLQKFTQSKSISAINCFYVYLYVSYLVIKDVTKATLCLQVLNHNTTCKQWYQYLGRICGVLSPRICRRASWSASRPGGHGWPWSGFRHLPSRSCNDACTQFLGYHFLCHVIFSRNRYYGEYEQLILKFIQVRMYLCFLYLQS